jgi:hypothetical protein
MGRPPEPQLTSKKPLSPCWDIYLASSAPATLLGTIEAPNADAAIEAAVREFHVNDQHATRLIAILKSAGIAARRSIIARFAGRYRANRVLVAIGRALARPRRGSTRA